MVENAHLPLAATLPDLDAIAEEDGCRLVEMADECGRWLQAFGELRQSLVTPAARTVWTALVQGEFDQVKRTYERLLDEIAQRASATDRSQRLR